MIGSVSDLIGGSGMDPGFSSGGPSRVLTQGGPEPKICSKWGFPLEIASKLHDFKKILGPKAPLDLLLFE